VNAAQKAWATRRARLTATTAAVVIAATPAAAIVNVSNDATLAALTTINPAAATRQVAAEVACVVELYVDEQIGCGRFLFVVVEEGPQIVRLLRPSSLETVTVSRKYFDTHKIVPKRGAVNRTRVANIIRRNRALADKVNDRKGADVLADGGADAALALQLLAA
jgi:hypothetical protein